MAKRLFFIEKKVNTTKGYVEFFVLTFRKVALFLRLFSGWGWIDFDQGSGGSAFSNGPSNPVYDVANPAIAVAGEGGGDKMLKLHAFHIGALECILEEVIGIMDPIYAKA